MKNKKSGKRSVAKRRTLPRPAETKYSILWQIVQWIPSGLIQRTADEHGLDTRRFSPLSHVVALLYGQLAHLLLRFMAHLSKWGLSFSRLAGIVRHTLWLRRDLMQNLFYYGTAGPLGGDGTVGGVVEKQGFFDFYVETHGTAD